MTNDQNTKCNIAIHPGAAAAAIGAGLAQIPGSDNVALVAVQITMVIALGKIFDIQVSDTAARGMAMTTVTTMTGSPEAQVTSWFYFALGNKGNDAPIRL